MPQAKNLDRICQVTLDDSDPHFIGTYRECVAFCKSVPGGVLAYSISHVDTDEAFEKSLLAAK